MNRRTRRMAQDELAAMEQNPRLAMFHQNQGFLRTVQELERRGRDAENQAILESSARCETALSTELRAVQGNNESTSKFEAAFKQHWGFKEPHADRAQSIRSGMGCPVENLCRIKYFMDTERTLGILKRLVVRGRDLVRQASKHLREMYESSKKSARPL